MNTRNVKAKRKSNSPALVGSGNVFADMGLPDPDKRLAKAKLAGEIARIIDDSRMTQVEAAKRLGIDQPKVSLLMRGQLKDFSMERLFQFLNRLGCNIEIGIGKAGEPHPGLKVFAKAG